MSFENRIAIVSRDFAFANNLKEFLQKEKLLNDVIVKGSFLMRSLRALPI